jgi:hypothetical protein
MKLAAVLRAQRALLRIELAELRRHPPRAWLVALLVAIPVTGLVAGGALARTARPTPAEERARALGAADLRIEARSLAELDVALPAAARVVPLRVDIEQLVVSGRRIAARSLALAAKELAPGGLAHGLVRIVEGDAPTAADEVALSPALADALAQPPGSTLTLSDRPLCVTGLVVDPEDLDAPLVLRALAAESEATAWLVGTSPEAAARNAVAARQRGARAVTRPEIGGSDGFEDAALLAVGGFAFAEAALVIAAAFAVSLRRRQREIGLVGANGARAGSIVTSVVASAAVLAVLGILVGLVLGFAAAGAVHPFLDGWNRRLNGALELSYLHVGAAVALGLGAALSAALPARYAARLPIRIALGGRRPVATPARRWRTAGLTLFACGAALVLLGRGGDGPAAGAGVLAGSVVALLGLGALSPWLLEGLARCAAPLPLPWRLAVRDAGRLRARNGPVVTAVLAGMALSVLLAAVLESVEHALDARPRVLGDDQLLVEGPGAEDVARALSGAGVECAPVSELPGGEPGHPGARVRWLVRLAAPVTPGDVQHAQRLAAGFAGTHVSADPRRSPPERTVLSVALALALSAGLVVVFVATALSTAESSADARVLHAVGAAPRLLARIAAARAGYLALLGGALAVPAGLLPALGLLRLAHVPLAFCVPWTAVAVTVVGFPVLAHAATWLAATRTCAASGPLP